LQWGGGCCIPLLVAEGEVVMSREYLVCFVEMVFGVGMFLNAMLFVPQAVKIYKTKDVKGLSLAMFGGFNVVQVFAILHGCIHADYILVSGFALSLVLSGVVTFLILLYRK
jgi:MtN3 and saliva related transmembrane protein